MVKAVKTNRRQPWRWSAAIAVAVGWFVALIIWAPPALAHTAFESSNPADGSTVDTAVNKITITFTAAAEPAGDGFVVLTAAGVIIEPAIDVSPDQRTFTLTLDEALVDGTVGVRWSVRAGDAHPIEGSFSFTTTAPAPTPTPVPSPTPDPTPTPDTSPTATVAAEATEVPAGPTAVPTQAPVEEVEDAEDEEAAASPAEGGGASAGESAAPVDLDTFLEGDADDGVSASDAIGFVGRALTMAAALAVVGATAIALVLASSIVGELHSARWILALAAVLAVGVVAEGAAFVIDGAGSVLEGQTGVALGLRLAGAVALAVGAIRSIAPIQLVGAAAILGSFAFDGHTVTEGNRLVTAAADIVHVGAASIWMGGIAILVALRYSKATNPTPRFTDFAARFSVIATFSIAVVGAAGIALTATILDSVSDLWSTSWGQTLIAKSGVVAVALALGAYNHFKLVPAIGRDGTDAVARLGRVLRVEVVVLVAVATLTAMLVAAQT